MGGVQRSGGAAPGVRLGRRRCASSAIGTQRCLWPCEPTPRPAIFTELVDGTEHSYLLYAVAGESGIALAQIDWA